MSVDVIMPQMGESIAEGTITKWLKKVGDKIKRDEPLFEISTDKVDAEIPAPSAGVLSEILFPEGETVEINVVVARIDADGKGSATGDGSKKKQAAEAEAEEEKKAGDEKEAEKDRRASAASTEQKERPKPEPPAADDGRGGENGGEPAASREDLRRTRSSPVVRKIAAEHDVDISAIEGTGISGRVTKRDILAYIERGGTDKAAGREKPAASYAAGEDARVEPMTTMRKKIAEHMVMSRRTSAHVTTFFEVDMTNVAKLRARHKADFEAREGINLTYLAFIAKAAIDGIRQFPIINSSVDGDNIVYKRHVNLGIAVALDWGLIVPVLKKADEMNILGLARGIVDLGERARNKKLTPDDVAGGTFTITNPGGFGGLIGTPIINQPQVAIMGVGAIQKRPVVIDDAIAIRTMGMLCLSFDHRIIDGADADRYMAAVKTTLEKAAFTDLGD